MKKYKRMTYTDRIRIETLYNSAAMCPYRIAKEVGFSHPAVLAELKRGFYMHRNGKDWTETQKYSAYKAQRRADFERTTKGAQLKVGNDHHFIHVLEDLMLQRKLSPAAALAVIRREQIPVDTNICVSTLYNYIRQGLFPNLTSKHLPYYKPKHKKRKIHPIKQAPIGISIERRPEEIQNRSDFGNWELDSVIGSNRKGNTLLVLTERKTRYEMIFRAKDKSALSTVQVLNRLERYMGPDTFKKVFKTITCDNGTEFSDVFHMETSIFGSEKRTQFYYCHPYCSCERGSNENQNRIIRRFIRKGTPIKHYSDEEIAAVELYMNTLPRKLFDWDTSQERFEKELASIGINFFDKL